MNRHAVAACHRHRYELPPRDPALYSDHVRHLQQAATRIRSELGLPPVRVEEVAPGMTPNFREVGP